VFPGTIREDLFRRDFTVNAMACGISPGRWGKLVDDFNGQSDLKKRRIRVLHEKSFLDDPTRILRAVRFEQRFGFPIERQTLGFLKQALKDGWESRVKPPRYFEEFKKILKEHEPLPPILRLKQLRGLSFLGGQVFIDKLLFKRAAKFAILPRVKNAGALPERWLIFFLAIACRTPEKVLREMFVRFNLPAKARGAALSVSRSGDLIKQLSADRVSRSRVYRLLNSLELEAVLFLKALGPETARRRIDRFLKTDRFARLTVSGHDIKGLGVAPGHQIGWLMKELLNRKIDRGIKSKKEELAEVRGLLRHQKKGR
jgi:tRNA nucleotidyltransferase (CCA-adding enzyme)